MTFSYVFSLKLLLIFFITQCQTVTMMYFLSFSCHVKFDKELPVQVSGSDILYKQQAHQFLFNHTVPML